MRKKINSIIESIAEADFSAREIFMGGAALFLLGIVIGIFFTPKKNVMIGSKNGNDNIGSIGDVDDYEDEEE